VPNSDRLWYIGAAFRRGYSVQKVHRLTQIDPWFLNHIREIILFEKKLKSKKGRGFLSQAKREGFSDRRIASLID